MKIIVCVKQVPDTSVPLDFDLDRGVIREESIVYVLNQYDEYAVEEALRIKEAVGGEVNVICLGPSRSEEALRYCLSMGVDAAIHLKDESFADCDAYATGTILAKAIDKVGYDLILCGVKSCDGTNAQVGATIAELLNLPQVSNVFEIQVVQGGKIAKLTKLIERGNRVVVECPLPGVFTIEKGMCEIRYPTLPKRLEAQKAVIVTYDARSLKLSESEVGLTGSLIRTLNLSIPRPKPKRVSIPDSNLSVEARLKLLLSGGVAEKKGGDIVEGPALDIAGRVVKYLAEKRFIITD